jgi:hypothetical protein
VALAKENASLLQTDDLAASFNGSREFAVSYAFRKWLVHGQAILDVRISLAGPLRTEQCSHIKLRDLGESRLLGREELGFADHVEKISSLHNRWLVPAFISALPIALNTITCSPTDCQCHGTLHPAVIFSSIAQTFSPVDRNHGINDLQRTRGR